MAIERQYRVELHPSDATERAPAGCPTCHQPITLDGVKYSCRREALHSGVHDAHARHTDGGFVRW